ncbi:hypothetical protein CHLRE_02g087750v5 [Chlamydomonas reinhardtii]|uniref:Protein kinase domain-containing protein n=1 Tax=Chlamydomonas reinhardtii TaxID=3055 RepID=A0A2K3E112_CHLRE|nr:uncharacterized protein CHLRE_02g087750v5 [Chlamydomonas reinhardtii]PNW86471.1 hypothetical protein CHLRE_02g087750v5 [Chlamydomonas reinhardtii]
MASGVTLNFVGLELLGAYGLIGPQFRFLRQSDGAIFMLNNTVHRRRAGLPMSAAIINHGNFARPPDVPGVNTYHLLYNWTYWSTGRGRKVDAESVMQDDYVTIATPDTTSAFQGYLFGGFRYTSYSSVYAVDSVVDAQCLKERTATDCVAIKLKELDQQAAAAAAAAQSTPADSSNTTTIIIAVVVPVASVLLIAAVMGVVILRRRDRFGGLPAAKYDAEAPAPGGGVSRKKPAAAGGSGVEVPSGADTDDTGMVFLGLEPGQKLPEWRDVDVGDPVAASAKASPKHSGGIKDKSFKGSKGSGGDRMSKKNGSSGLNGTSADGDASGHRQQDSPACRGPRAATASPHAPCSPQHPHTGPLGIAAATAAAAATLTPTNGNSSIGPYSIAPNIMRAEGAIGAAGGTAAGGLATPGGGLNPNGSAVSRERKDSSKPLSQVSTVSGPDVQGELGVMARELRATVKDIAVRLDDVIGSGTFGVVFRGTWQGLPVAIKTVVFSASTEHRKRALHEAALASSIVHPNIIATFCTELQPLGGQLGMIGRTSGGDSGQQQGGVLHLHTDGSGPGGDGEDSSPNMSAHQDWRLYIIQEYADGGPLSGLYGNPAIWQAPGHVHLPSVVALAAGVARALTHLHSKRIVHGDLNPNNVLLKKDVNEPSGYAAKVGDFGLSVMLPQHQSHLSNIRMGTMFYICPAVVLKAQVGPPSDIFSLGVLLWELYNGRLAGTQTPEGPRYAPTFPAFPTTCPAAYRDVAMGCLQKHPANRPVAAQVEEALAKLLHRLCAGATRPAGSR